MIRTRFAPSPTGFLHIGGARTALFCWAHSRKNNGKFILRIEDTDLERSTQASVDSIIDAMNWLNLDYDEGPFYQTKRMERYQEMIKQLLDSGHAYRCYCTKEELNQMREEQKAQGLKAKYDRRCLNKETHDNNKPYVIRFKNPTGGSVVWHDLVKGKIEISNQELDDLIIARSDGSPTYNFCVVVDDLDMKISHVIRGDDHINNTPRQINIFKAFNQEVPLYAHVPMILRDDGQKMSKRTDAVSVMQYKDMGILPEALLNYLARLCWGHGDNEIFTMQEFLEWFNLEHVSSSPARFDIKKLFWVNSNHIKMKDNHELAALVIEILNQKNIQVKESPKLVDVIQLVKSRSDNLNSLAAECSYFYNKFIPTAEEINQYLTNDALVILNKFTNELINLTSWDLQSIKDLIKNFCANENIKMPQLGMPIRLKICGTKNTPSFDEVIHLLGKTEVIARLTPNA